MNRDHLMPEDCDTGFNYQRDSYLDNQADLANDVEAANKLAAKLAHWATLCDTCDGLGHHPMVDEPCEDCDGRGRVK